MTLNEFLDCNYGADGDDVLRRMLNGSADPNKREGPLSEAPLHVATRRRRASAVGILLDRGADIDAQTDGGKTVYAHAVRRGFACWRGFAKWETPVIRPAMKVQIRTIVVAGLCLLPNVGSGCARMRSQTPSTIEEETVLTHQARGTFEVKLNPQPPDDEVGDPTVGRMSIDKQFHGDLEATSKGQMLAVRTDVEGSAGYVAMERVTGTLHGRSGAFTLQHSGTMTRGAQQLTVTVVPDSGTGELVGLAGKMTIDIVDGKHFYDFNYTLPKPR